MEHSDAQFCKTCEAPLSGAYCSQCGQKVSIPRITVQGLFSDFFRQITNLDRGLWYTASLLFRNPGKVIRDYIGGRTLKYMAPIKYLVLWTTIGFLVFYGLGVFEQQAVEMSEALAPAPSAKQLAFQEKWANILKNYSQIFGMLLVPMYAIFSYLFFRPHGFNYAEHLVANAYFSGQTALIGTIFNPFLLLIPDKITLSLIFSFGISIAYYTVGLRSLFAQGWISTFFKTLLIIFLGFIGYSIIISIVGITIAIIFTISGNI